MSYIKNTEKWVKIEYGLSEKDRKDLENDFGEIMELISGIVNNIGHLAKMVIY